jgi:hypothetical protein
MNRVSNKIEEPLTRITEICDSHQIDRVWVNLVNRERLAQRQEPVSYELFEVIMDKLEKEWFDLVSTSFYGNRRPYITLCRAELVIDQEDSHSRESSYRGL